MGEVSEAEFWRRISYALFRRVVGRDAAASSIKLDRSEVDAGAMAHGDFDNEADDKVLVRFEKVES